MDEPYHGSRASGPSRVETATAATLLAIWTILMTFGIVSFLNPPWLAEISE